MFFSSKDVKQQTIYEYHRVEINTTRIVSGSAFEFTPLPSKCPHTLGCWQVCLRRQLPNFRTSSSLSSTHILRTLHDIQLDDRVRLVQHASAVGWNFSVICPTFNATERHFITPSSLDFRCSDGIDRHRQEWLDYNCLEEVREREPSPWYNWLILHWQHWLLCFSRQKPRVKTTTQSYLIRRPAPTTIRIWPRHHLRPLSRICPSPTVCCSEAGIYRETYEKYRPVWKQKHDNF